jgi:hypothetical protein
MSAEGNALAGEEAVIATYLSLVQEWQACLQCLQRLESISSSQDVKVRVCGGAAARPTAA